LSQTGKGLLLGNPHRSWTGDGSFYQVRLTLPGEYDVAGAALQGLPWVGIGFNSDLAWTHTTSFATRFTLYELELNPLDLMQYRYDGEWRDITTEEVAIQAQLEDGLLEERTHTFYRSHFGPIVNLKEISPLFRTWPLANGSVLALRDANTSRAGAFFEQYRRMGQAEDMDDFTEALKSIATPVFHTLAADRDGEAFYGEVAAIPHVTQAQLDDCLTRIGRLLAGLANNAVSEAVLALEDAGVALDAPWGDVQFAARNNLRIPIHGADGDLGDYGAISSRFKDGGYPAHTGNSHLQAVTWDEDECPIADTLLVPSQSSDPGSPHFADQTELYSRKEWVRFPYCEGEISAAQIGETVVVEE